MSECLFCSSNYESVFKSVFKETAHNYVVFDNYPSSRGHVLIISKGHYCTLSEAPVEVLLDAAQLIQIILKELKSTLNPDGFNVGVNDGPAAGQSIPHLHIHIIPRYHGDHPNPKGGLRAVLPQTFRYIG
jgi:diadenosine tetraphosphate (Ap4A) HIT family hydrolase